jgi:hypothetical protein
MHDDIENAMRELKDVYHVLVGDVDAAVAYGKASPTNYAVRALFRNYFAFIDGMTYQFRRIALICAEYDSNLLTTRESQIIKEERYRLNHKGVSEAVPEYQSVLPSILFSIRCFARVWGATFEPDTSHHGWDALQKFVKIRNGLEHPKSVRDLELDDNQRQIGTDAAQWWKQTVIQLLEACRLADESFR